MDNKKEIDITKETPPDVFKKQKRWVYILPGVLIGLITIGILVFLIVSGFINK